MTGCKTSVTSRTTMPEPPRSVTSASLEPAGIFEAHVIVAFGGGVRPLRLGVGNANGDAAGDCVVGVGCVPDVVLPHAARTNGTTISAMPFANARVYATGLRLIAARQRDAVYGGLAADKAFS